MSHIEEYKKAAAYWNYPEVPYGQALREMIRPDDVVADIGCGIGVVSQFMAPLCKQVLAIDKNEEVLQSLQKDLQEKSIDNVKPIHARWPDVSTEDWDVAIAIYHYHFGYTNLEIDTLLRKTRRSGLIISQGVKEREGFHRKLSQELGLQDRQSGCVSSCYVRGRLEQAGFQVTCEEIEHDFGQPVDDKEEAVAFLRNQLRLDESYEEKLKEIAFDYVENIDGQMVFPIKRFNCLLRFAVPGD
ncbi:MAG TPA: hypothetical protein DD636_00600 [Anaerolineaceae bacterium]|jgi:SAM-dependent methyltransferase|nr:hypothetical protein [Anaerolineaceae bacterium]